MTTTFETYPVGWYQNYCSRPTKDVEIIESQPICDGADFIPPVGESSPGNRGSYGPKCHKPIERKPDAKSWDFNPWQHVDGSDSHHVRNAITCRFCGNNEPGTVHYKQESWSDQTTCDRCGGSNGYAIGD